MVGRSPSVGAVIILSLVLIYMISLISDSNYTDDITYLNNWYHLIFEKAISLTLENVITF